MSKELAASLTFTLATMIVFGLGISYSMNELDYLFEPKPEVGQIWFPDYRTVQPYWHDDFEAEVIEIRGDFMRAKWLSTISVYNIQEFHEMFNFARKDTSLTK